MFHVPLCLCLTFQQKSALRLARVQGCPLLFFFGFAGYVCFGFCVNGFAYRLICVVVFRFLPVFRLVLVGFCC